MTVEEIRLRIKELLVTIAAAEEDLVMLRDGAAYDENYKIEREGKQLTPENFDRAYKLAHELCEATDVLLRKKS